MDRFSKLFEEIWILFQDGDGKLSLEEYIGDMYHHDEEDGPEGEEPEWVKRERESFNEVRDTNNDGFMDNNEVSTTKKYHAIAASNWGMMLIVENKKKIMI